MNLSDIQLNIRGLFIVLFFSIAGFGGINLYFTQDIGNQGEQIMPGKKYLPQKTRRSNRK